jgi:hypothetical protein
VACPAGKVKGAKHRLAGRATGIRDRGGQAAWGATPQGGLNRAGFAGGSEEVGALEKAKTAHRYSAEVRLRAVRMVLEHRADHASRWAATGSIAAKIGCIGETFRGLVRQAERDQGLRAGPTELVPGIRTGG